MQIPRPSDADKARFASLVPPDQRVEVKLMFGNLGAFVNGNMFMGLLGADVGVKLDADDQRQLSDAGGGPFGQTDRPMGGYVSLPATLTPADAQPWIEKSLHFVAALPPKKARPAKKK